MLSLATAPACRACSPATPDDFFKFILVAFCVTRLHLVTGLIGKCFYVFVGGGGYPFPLPCYSVLLISTFYRVTVALSAER